MVTSRNDEGACRQFAYRFTVGNEVKVAGSVERPDDKDQQNGAQGPVEEANEADARATEQGENAQYSRAGHREAVKVGQLSTPPLPVRSLVMQLGTPTEQQLDRLEHPLTVTCRGSSTFSSNRTGSTHAQVSLDGKADRHTATGYLTCVGGHSSLRRHAPLPMLPPLTLT